MSIVDTCIDELHKSGCKVTILKAVSSVVIVFPDKPDPLVLSTNKFKLVCMKVGMEHGYGF